MSISSVSNFSFSLSYAELSMSQSTSVENQLPANNSTGTTAPASIENNHHHGQFMQALKITLIQIGINISGQSDPTTSSTNPNSSSTTTTLPSTGTSGPTDTTSLTSPSSGNTASNSGGSSDTNALTQALHAFMHAMFQAMNQITSGSGGEGHGEREGDHDDDDGQRPGAPQSTGYSSTSTQVGALLQSIQTDATNTNTPTSNVTAPEPATTVPTAVTPTTGAPSSNPIDELKKAFASLFDAITPQNNGTPTTPVTLQSFLESLVNNLSTLQTDHQSLSITGMVINISA